MDRVKDLRISFDMLLLKLTSQERKVEIECPVCDGEGLETVDVPKPQSSSRDVGEIYEELRTCERCDGSGLIEMDDE
jgi:C4-type Zn-finger protein